MVPFNRWNLQFLPERSLPLKSEIESFRGVNNLALCIPILMLTMEACQMRKLQNV